MNKNLHFWTVKHWMNRSGQNNNGFVIWCSPAFAKAAAKAMETLDEASCQDYARQIIKSGMPRFEGGFHSSPLMFRPEVGLAHFDVPGNACGMDLDWQHSHIEEYGFELLPHNIDTPDQQSTLFAIWLWWAKAVETYVDAAEEGAG